MNATLFEAPLGPLSMAFPSTARLERFPNPDDLLTCGLWQHSDAVATFILRPPKEHLSTYRESLKLMTAVLIEAKGDRILGAHLRWWDGGNHPLSAPKGGWPRGAVSLKRLSARWSGYAAIGLWPADSVQDDPRDALELTTCELHVVKPGYPAAADALAEKLRDPDLTLEQRMRMADVFSAAW